MSRPGADTASVLTPEHGRLYFQCARCGAVSRRLDRFYEHLAAACFRAELVAGYARREAAEAVEVVWLPEPAEVAS